MPHKRNPVLSENISGLSRIIRSLAQSTLENIPLWHERDISHSSTERFVAPDITITLDFMLGRMNSLIQGLQVYPEQMKSNLEMTRGLVYSGTLLPILAAKGMTRENAYALVQKHALETWDSLSDPKEKRTFYDRVKADGQITKLLSAKDLDEVFSLERHTAHVDYIFKRVFGHS